MEIRQEWADSVVHHIHDHKHNWVIRNWLSYHDERSKGP